MNNRLPRAQREALERQDAQFRGQPLNNQSVAAHLRHLVKLLSAKRSASPCSDAVGYLHALYDRTVAEMAPSATARLACKEGCSHCCLQPVGVTAAEAFAIARQLRGREATLSAVRHAGQRLALLPPEQRVTAGRCLMLEGGLCTIYAQRPLGCRTFVSFDVNPCIAKFVMLGNAEVRGPDEYGATVNACRTILYAAFGLIGRRDHTAGYEMKAALAAVLEAGEDAEARWLAGENVLQDVVPLPPVQPEFAWEIANVMRAVAPTL